MLHYVRMILSNASEQEITPTANAEDLATKANLLAAIVESSEDAIIGETLDGSISSWNKGAKKMFGYGSEEVIGQPVLMIIPKERADELSQLTVKIKEGKSVPHYETVRVGKDGSLMDVSVSLSPIHDSQQKLVGAAAIYRSITERKQASQYARSLIEASQDPLVTISPEGKITDVNEATIKVTGVTRELLIGTDFSEYFTEPQKAHDGYEQAFKLGFVTDYPLTIKSKEGKLTDVLYNASVYKDDKGNVLGVFAAARDYTSAKKATEGAAVATKEMESFSYSVSHDLRAPLRAIDGFTQILMEQYGEKLDDEGKRITSIIRASTVQMGKLIDDLLSFARLGRQEVKKDRVIMSTLADETYKEVRKASPERAIAFSMDPLPDVRADADMIRQVWTNLFTNAIKFTGKKESAKIEVGSTSDGNSVTYFVKDNGAGFDMQYIDKLFGVFQRLHSAEEFEGTGVGLANIKRIIERHGGSVRAEGHVGEGATFFFTLPTA